MTEITKGAVAAAARQLSLPEFVVKALESRPFEYGPAARRALEQIRNRDLANRSEIAGNRPTIRVNVRVSQGQLEILERNNPSVSIKISQQAVMNAHPLAAAQKRLDDCAVLSCVADMPGPILDVGGNFMHHLQMRDARFHCTYLASGAQDAIRTNTRGLSLAAHKRLHMHRDETDKNLMTKFLAVGPDPDLYEFYTAHRKETYNWYCQKGALGCDCGKFNAAVLNHCYDLTLAELAELMHKHGMNTIVGAIHGNPDIVVGEIDEKGTQRSEWFGNLHSVGMQYHVDARSDIIRFVFHDDNALGYTHTYSHYRRYLTDSHVARMGPYDYYYKIIQRNGDSLIYRMIRVIAADFTKPMPASSLITSGQRDMCRLHGWFYDKSFIGSSKYNSTPLKRGVVELPVYLVDLVEQRAHDHVVGGTILEHVISEIRNWTTSIHINGVPIQGDVAVNEREFYFIAVNLLAKAKYDDYVSRAQVGLFTAPELKRRQLRELAFGGLFRELISSTATSVLTAVRDLTNRLLTDDSEDYPVTVERISTHHSLYNRGTVESLSIRGRNPRKDPTVLNAALLSLATDNEDIMRTVRPRLHKELGVGIADALETAYKEPSAPDKTPIAEFNEWIAGCRETDTPAMKELMALGHTPSGSADDNYRTRREAITEAIEYHKALITQIGRRLRETGNLLYHVESSRSLTTTEFAVEATVGRKASKRSINVLAGRKKMDVWRVHEGQVVAPSLSGTSLQGFKYMAVFAYERNGMGRFLETQIGYDGRVVTSVNISNYTGEVLVDDDLEIFTSPAVIEAMEAALAISRRDYIDYPVAFHAVVAGGGKSRRIRLEADAGDLVTSPTRHATTDNREGLRAAGRMTDVQSRCRTLDSFLSKAADGTRLPSTRTLWVDEIGLAHQGLSHALAFLSRCERVVALWDPWQIIFRERATIEARPDLRYICMHKRLNTILSYNFSWISYRVPANYLAAVARHYGYRIRTTVAPTSALETVSGNPSGAAPLNLPRNAQHLCFTQAEKDVLVKAGHKSALTVNEAQGGEWSEVVLVTTPSVPLAIYSEPDFLVTLFTRAKRSIRYYKAGNTRNDIDICIRETNNAPLVRRMNDTSSAGRSINDM